MPDLGPLIIVTPEMNRRALAIADGILEARRQAGTNRPAFGRGGDRWLEFVGAITDIICRRSIGDLSWPVVIGGNDPGWDFRLDDGRAVNAKGTDYVPEGIKALESPPRLMHEARMELKADLYWLAQVYGAIRERCIVRTGRVLGGASRERMAKAIVQQAGTSGMKCTNRVIYAPDLTALNDMLRNGGA